MVTKREAAIISAYTGYVIGNFGDMKEYAEEVMGEVLTDTAFVMPEFVEKLKEEAEKDLDKIAIE